MNKNAKPSKEEILAQLNRILNSQKFKGSLRLSNFLEYIIVQTLLGKSDQIKGYTIGVEALGKPKNFDPDNDASVRVEAIRLRKELRLFYHEEGRNDPVIIRVAKGKYIPTFFYNITNKDEIEPVTDVKKKTKPHIHIIVSVLSFIICVLLWQTYAKNITWSSPKNIVATAPMSPVIVVLPFHAIGNEETKKLSEHLMVKLVNKLTVFDSLSAYGGESMSDYEHWKRQSTEMENKTNANYLIEGTVRQRIDNLHVSIRVLDLQKNTYIWSHDKDYKTGSVDQLDFEEELTSEIASRLASPYGIIQAFEYSRMKNVPGSAADAYRCVLDVYTYANDQTPKKHKEVRKCLEKSVKNYPEYVEAWSLLSYLYIEEIKLGYNPRNGPIPANVRAMKAAQRSVEIDPRSARAHQNMAEVAKLYNDESLLRRHLKIAILLNPNDSEVLATAAWSYGEMGEWALAKELAKKAARLNVGHPRWYHGILFSCYYQDGQYSDALTHALKYFQAGYLYSHIALATSYAQLYQTEEAKKIVDGMEQRFPDFKENPKASIAKLSFKADFREKLIIGLKKAGVVFEAEDE